MMKRRRLLFFGLCVAVAVLFVALTFFARCDGRLVAVEFERPIGELFHTEDPDFLSQVEAWHHSIEGPSLEQRWLRFTGRLSANGLRQPDYEVILLFKNGRREELAVWVYEKDYVPVHTARWSGSSGVQGYSCLTRSEPFTALTHSMRGRER